LLLYFLQGLALALPSTVVPSPLKVFLISQALENGWRRTLPAALAPLVTDGPIIILSLLVLTQTPDWFLNMLRILGGFFILYLARRIFLLLRTGGGTLQPSPDAARQSFFKAIGINVLNPNPYILWGVVAGPIVLDAWRQQSLAVGLSFIAGFYITFVIGLSILIFIFATAGRLNPGLNRALIGFSGVALLLFGIYQIYVGSLAFIN